MYCQLCHVEASPSHDSSSGHRAAKELAAVAVGRLINHLAAGDSARGNSNVIEADKSSKSPEAVSFCDSCNDVFLITELSSHLRTRDHALALLNEQAFEQLVESYIGEAPLMEPIDPTDDVAFADKNEAINTYICLLCDLEVPQVFQSEHERGSRHRTSLKLTLAAARRARDSISARSGRTKDGRKFTGKMMKRLLRVYSGGYDDDKKVIAEAERAEPSKPEPQRLTAKEYFSAILPFLPYVGSFYTLIVDDTEFVTIQISNETLKIHVNNFNGLYNVEGNGGYVMNCRLCDGFTNACYSSLGHQDKLHVMSLGHIKNVLSPIENVHLIRKIDETHSVCGLCNVLLHSNLADNHILKDTRHTLALSEALDRGKQYEEKKENVKIMIFMPTAPKQSVFMKPNQFNTGWTFGGAQPKLFGSAQNPGIGSTQNAGVGWPQNSAVGNTQNSVFGSSQNTGFGSAKNTGFGSAQTTQFFGSAQPSVGRAQSSIGGAKGSVFGAAQTQVQPSVFNSALTQQNTTAFGTFGNQNTNLSAQNQAQSGVINNASSNQNTSHCGTAAVWNSSGSFGSSQTSTNNSQGLFGNAQPNIANSGESQGHSAVFGCAQNTVGLFGNSQKKAACACGQNQKNTSIIGWGGFNNKGNFASTNQPSSIVHVLKTQNSNTPFKSSSSSANSVDSQQTNAFVNAQSTSQIKESNRESEKKFGDAQTQSETPFADVAQINKHKATIRPPMKPRSDYTSSDSE